MKNISARNMWGDYMDRHLEDAFAPTPKVEHFCDNKEDADICAALAASGTKRATTPSLLELQLNKEPLPKIGDFRVVTNWEGEAACVVKTVSVKLKPFFSITEEYAQLEGEGDKSLAYWKKSHWGYYTRALEKFNRKPHESMVVVCEVFEKVNRS